ncbi:MAG: metallophosphoesterase [Myxococcota bacterium]
MQQAPPPGHHTVKRHLALHAPGHLLVSTDIHGNWEDFSRLEQIFHDLSDCTHHPVYWVVLGDIVHGPSASMRHRFGGLYDYDDASARIVERMVTLREQHPEHVHFVLGNHDYAHVGGRTTSKFYGNEAQWLESQMDPEAIVRMHRLFTHAWLAVSTDCGVLLCHGSPDERLSSFERLDAVQMPARGEDYTVIQDMLYAYGQSAEVIDRTLAGLSNGPGFTHAQPLRVVVHGHDRDEEGYYFDDHNQVCPVIFGAPREQKRYIVLDLSARYERSTDFTEGEVLRYLYPRSE